MKYYIRVYTGFREDQYHTIPMQEAHKAYYLFNHPEERGIFENGVAIIGKNIQEIKPDYNTTMGYNPSYKLQDDDWNSIREAGIDTKMKLLIEKAKDVSFLVEEDKTLMKNNLEQLINSVPKSIFLR